MNDRITIAALILMGWCSIGMTEWLLPIRVGSAFLWTIAWIAIGAVTTTRSQWIDRD